MSVSTQASPCLVSRHVIKQCVEFAHSHGVRDFPSDRRSTLRSPFVHPVHYCLDSVPSQGQTYPGYTLNINSGGMALCSRQALALDTPICVCLPLPDGSNAWVSGKVVHCHADKEQHYWVGISFLAGNKS